MHDKKKVAEVLFEICEVTANCLIRIAHLLSCIVWLKRISTHFVFYFIIFNLNIINDFGIQTTWINGSNCKIFYFFFVSVVKIDLKTISSSTVLKSFQRLWRENNNNNKTPYELRCHWECVFSDRKKTSAVGMGRVCSGSSWRMEEKKICAQIFFFGCTTPCVRILLRKNSSLIRLYGRLNVCVNCVLLLAFFVFFFALSWSEYWTYHIDNHLQRRKGIMWMIYDRSLNCNFKTLFFPYVYICVVLRVNECACVVNPRARARSFTQSQALIHIQCISLPANVWI